MVYARDWKDGKPVADEQGNLHGVSQLVKVLKLESYEDTLNNLTLKGQLSLDGLPEKAQEDYLLRYMLNTESKDSLIKTDQFAKPFAYQLNISTDSAGAYQTQTVDLVETFNYLLGLRVQAVDYSPRPVQNPPTHPRIHFSTQMSLFSAYFLASSPLKYPISGRFPAF